MGLYINQADMPLKGRAQWAVKHLDARLVSFDEARSALPDEAVLCAVDNGHFEALIFCLDVHEIDRFNNFRDGWLKRWLLAKRTLIEKLAS